MKFSQFRKTKFQKAKILTKFKINFPSMIYTTYNIQVDHQK